MIVIRQNEDTIEQGIVATIGFFDGVHVGHRFLIKELQDWGKELNMPSAVITFPEHPRQVLHSDYRPKLLDTFQEKMERLETTSIDHRIGFHLRTLSLFRCRFYPPFSRGISCERFADWLRPPFRA